MQGPELLDPQIARQAAHGLQKHGGVHSATEGDTHAGPRGPQARGHVLQHRPAGAGPGIHPGADRGHHQNERRRNPVSWSTRDAISSTEELVVSR